MHDHHYYYYDFCCIPHGGKGHLTIDEAGSITVHSVQTRKGTDVGMADKKISRPGTSGFTEGIKRIK